MKTRPGICNRKKSYAVRDDAEAAAANAPFKLRVYRCELCRKYHLTSRTKGMKIPRHELDARRQSSAAGSGSRGVERWLVKAPTSS